MPRLRVPPSLRTKPKYPADGDGPRLWNAKRRIKTSKGLPSFASLKHLEANSVRDWYAETRPTLPATLQEAVEKVQLKDGKLEWWKLDGEHLENFMDAHEQLREVSKDVRSFIASTSHVYKQRTILEILRDPSRFFSNSSNVPLAMRKQVHFPKIKDYVVLMRTPHLGPRYAAFGVPLRWGKLDLRAYLKDVYNVDSLHIRSVVVQSKVTRKDSKSARSQGALYRPPSTKKMTVQLAKPFVYPEELEDLSPWDNEEYWKSRKALVAHQREQSEWQQINPNYNHRTAIALQARQLLKGETKWAPTWRNFAPDVRAMQGSSSHALPPPRRQPPPAT